jgi:hypothetical protein
LSASLQVTLQLESTLIDCLRGQPPDSFWVGPVEPSGAEMGVEKHDVLVLMLHNRRVVYGFHWVGDFGLGEDGVVTVSSDNGRLNGRLFASRSKIVE